jgi:hypothetical protein
VLRGPFAHHDKFFFMAVFIWFFDSFECAEGKPDFNHAQDSFLDGWLADIEVQGLGDSFSDPRRCPGVFPPFIFRDTFLDAE